MSPQEQAIQILMSVQPMIQDAINLLSQTPSVNPYVGGYTIDQLNNMDYVSLTIVAQMNAPEGVAIPVATDYPDATAHMDALVQFILQWQKK